MRPRSPSDPCILYFYRPPTLLSDGYAIFMDHDGSYIEVRWHQHLGLMSLRHGNQTTWKQGEMKVIGQSLIVVPDEDGSRYADAVADPAQMWARLSAERAQEDDPVQPMHNDAAIV